jgi:hypothetical protein
LRGTLPFNLEVLVGVMTLVLDIRRNDLVGHITAAAAEVPPCPNVPSRELLAKVRKLRQELIGSLALETLHQAADGHLRRNRHKEVDVVLGHVTLEDADILITANLPQQVSNPKRNFPRQHLAPVLGHPYHVEVDLKNRVSAAPILLHTRRLPSTPARRMLKPSPEGEGFNPPSGGQ